MNKTKTQLNITKKNSVYKYSYLYTTEIYTVYINQIDPPHFEIKVVNSTVD